MKIFSHQPSNAPPARSGMPASTNPLTPSTAWLQPSSGNLLETLSQWQAEADASPHADNRCKWLSSQFPLQVHILPDESTEGGIYLPPSEVLTALQPWAASSQGMVQFQFAASPAQASTANILIQWSHECTLGRDYEVGHTRRTVQGNRILHAEITLIRQPAIDTHLSPAQQRQRLYTTILHETGHALGLEHSHSPKDVMYYRGWQNTQLSPQDIHQLQRLYPPKPSFG